MAGEIVVFLGPSLPTEEARRTLDARYLAPARCGDVLRARRMRPRAIAIIDGLFDSISSIWHKEILLALEDGIAVFGASSMGALRAAELAPFGMIGIGKIFEAYRDGLYTDDDEVALLHGSAAYGYPANSEAMVNIRATVAKAIAAGVIRPESGERMIRCAKDTFYPERSLDGAIEQVWGADAGGDEPTRLRRFLKQGGYVNQKRLDALMLLRHLAGLRSMPVRPVDGAAEVHRSCFVLKLQHEVMSGPFDAFDTDLPREEQVALEAAKHGPTYPLLRRLAKLMAVAHALACAQGLTPTPGEKARVFKHDDFGLGPNARTKQWAATRDLDEEARARFVDRLSRINTFLNASGRSTGPRRGRRRIDACLLALLRIHGQYAKWRPPGAGTGAPVDRAVLRAAARSADVEFGIHRRTATLWSAIDEAVTRLGIEPAGDSQILVDEFRRAQGLDRRDATLAWQRANNLNHDALVALAVTSARLSLLSDNPDSPVTRRLGLERLVEPNCWLLDAIRLTGQYAVLKRRVRSAVAPPGSALNRSRADKIARARTAKAAPGNAVALKVLTPKDPKNSKAVKKRED